MTFFFLLEQNSPFCYCPLVTLHAAASQPDRKLKEFKLCALNKFIAHRVAANIQQKETKIIVTLLHQG